MGTEERMAILLGVTAMAGASNSILQVKVKSMLEARGFNSALEFYFVNFLSL